MCKQLKNLLGSATSSAPAFSPVIFSSSKIMDNAHLCRNPRLQCSEDEACSYKELLRDGSPCRSEEAVEKKKTKKKKTTGQVAKGCVPVVVNGEHRMLFDVTCLSHPLVKSLLQRTAHEMGYALQYPGALQLSCDPASFPHLVRLATTTV